MSLRSFAVWLALLFAACGKFEIRSVPAAAVPAALQGEWRGTWVSAENGNGGNVVLTVRAFADQPIVGMSITNPCVTPRDYRFNLRGNQVELLADGLTVFSAVVAAEQTMVGEYQCVEDHGTWQVAWQRALPPIGDVSGTWVGAVDAGEAGQLPLLLHLNQTVRNGLLAVDGAVELPGVLPGSLPLNGVVNFGAEQFDLLMASPQSLSPVLQLAATGVSASMVIEQGFVQGSLTPQQPAQTATWHAALQPQ